MSSFFYKYTKYRWPSWLNRSKLDSLFSASILIGPGLQYAKVYLFHVLFIPIVVSFANRLINRKQTLSRPPLPLLLLSVYALIYTLSVCWSVHPQSSMKFVVIFFLGFGTIYLLLNQVRTVQSIHQLYCAFFYVWVIQAAVGLLEIFTPFRYPISNLSLYNHWFGIDFLGTWYNLDHPVIQTTPVGLSWSPNSYSTFMVISLPLLLSLKLKVWQKILIMGVSSAIVIYGRSKACIAGFTVVLLVVGLRHLWIASHFRRRLMAVGMALFLTPLLGLGLSALNVFDDFATSIAVVKNSFEQGQITGSPTESLPQRMNLYKNAFFSIEKNFWLGVGAGQSGSTVVHPALPAYESLHFYLLEPFVETGLIGFLFFSLALVSFGVQLFWRARTDPDLQYRELCFGLASALLAFVPASMSMSSAIYFLPWYFVLSLGSILLNQRPTPCEPEDVLKEVASPPAPFNAPDRG